jgi:hypothetical protein
MQRRNPVADQGEPAQELYMSGAGLEKYWERTNRLFYHKIDARVGRKRIVDALTSDELRALLKEAVLESGMVGQPEVADKSH